VAGARATYEDLLALSNGGERAPYNLAWVPAELGMADAADGWARAAMWRRDPAVHTFARGRFTPVEALRALPIHDGMMRALA